MRVSGILSAEQAMNSMRPNVPAAQPGGSKSEMEFVKH
jgi:hypothetical protein